MAPPAQIMAVVPETLPGDFVEWDEPVQSGSGEPSFGVVGVSEPATQSGEAHAMASPSGNLPGGGALSVRGFENSEGAGAPHPAQSVGRALLCSRDLVVPRQTTVPAMDERRLYAPRRNGAPAVATMTGFPEILLSSLRPNAVELTRPAKKWLIIAGACAVLAVIVVAAMVPVFNRGRVSPTEPAAAPAPAMTTSQQPNRAAPSRAHSTPKVRPSTAAAMTGGEAQISSEAARRRVERDATPLPEQAQMMDDQLHTPPRLKMKATVAEQAPLPPAGFAAAELDGLDNKNAIGSVFGSLKQQPREQVTFRQVAVSVPPSIALSMLIRKTQPIYPLLAKANRISGTIVLVVTVSKTGTVENLRVVSGPAILRESAVDAVRTWRFKPYMIDDQPMEMETTINLHFSSN